jgi:hypothetical protein
MAPGSGPDSTPPPSKKDRFLNEAISKARSTSNRKGSIAQAIEEERPQNRESLDFGDMLDQDLKEAGFQS